MTRKQGELNQSLWVVQTELVLDWTYIYLFQDPEYHLMPESSPSKKKSILTMNTEYIIYIVFKYSYVSLAVCVCINDNFLCK